MQRIYNIQEIFRVARIDDFVVDKFIFTINKLQDATFENGDYPIIDLKYVENVKNSDKDIMNIRIDLSTFTRKTISLGYIDATLTYIESEIMKKIMGELNKQVVAITSYSITLENLIKFNTVISKTYNKIENDASFASWERIPEDFLINNSLRVLDGIKIAIYVCRTK